VEACIRLSYKALGRFLLSFGSSSSPEKNISVMIRFLEESTVFSTICFNGIAVNVIERFVKLCDKRAGKIVTSATATTCKLYAYSRMRKEEIALCTLTISAIFDRRRNSIWQTNRVQSHVSSTLQLEQLWALSTVSTNG
ncbi:hypothetical protein ALC56_05558, partial [Trachymyrmex septentrionalis]